MVRHVSRSRLAPAAFTPCQNEFLTSLVSASANRSFHFLHLPWFPFPLPFHDPSLLFPSEAPSHKFGCRPKLSDARGASLRHGRLETFVGHLRSVNRYPSTCLLPPSLREKGRALNISRCLTFVSLLARGGLFESKPFLYSGDRSVCAEGNGFYVSPLFSSSFIPKYSFPLPHPSGYPPPHPVPKPAHLALRRLTKDEFLPKVSSTLHIFSRDTSSFFPPYFGLPPRVSRLLLHHSSVSLGVPFFFRLIRRFLGNDSST